MSIRKYKICRAALIVAMVLGLLIFLFLLGTDTADHVSGNKGKLTVIMNEENNLFWQGTWKGIREAAEEEGYAISEYQVASTDSIADYLKIALTTNTEGIIFNLSGEPDTETQQLLEQAREQGIVLVSVDSDMTDCRDIFIGMDNVASAETVASYIATNAGTEPIYIVDRKTYMSTTVPERVSTIKGILEDRGFGGQIQPLEISNEDLEAQNTMKTFLAGLEEEIWLVTCGPSQTLTAARIISALSIQDRVHLVGYGETDEIRDYQDKGIIEALLVQDNEDMGRLAVETEIHLLNGETYAEDILYSGHTLQTAAGTEDDMQ